MQAVSPTSCLGAKAPIVPTSLTALTSTTLLVGILSSLHPPVRHIISCRPRATRLLWVVVLFVVTWVSRVPLRLGASGGGRSGVFVRKRVLL